MNSRLAFVIFWSFYLSVLVASYLLVIFYPFFALYWWFLVPLIASFCIGYFIEDVHMVVKIIIAGFSLQAGIILVLLNFSPVYDAFLPVERPLMEGAVPLFLVPVISRGIYTIYSFNLFLMILAIVLYCMINIPLGITVSLVGTAVREDRSDIIAVCMHLVKKMKRIIETVLSKVRR